MHEKQTDYDRKSRAGKRERGLVRVEVWVPKEQRSEIQKIAKGMRDEQNTRA